jgi:4-hydroxy-tetrahydrodipicolinate synthase
MRADLSPDTPKWIAQCRHLLSAGCTALAPFGTTSEANSLGLDERIDMLDQLAAAGLPVARLIVGTGLCAIPETVKLSAQAARLGAGGVLLLPPFYYKGVSDEGIFRAVADVVERVGSERLRVYIYNIPPMAVVGYSLAVIERLIKTYPDTVVGIKDSSGDWSYQEAILKGFPGFQVFAGTEKFLLANLRLGGAGAISALANVIPDRIRQLHDNWQAGNADQLQLNLDGYRESMREYPLIPALKAIMATRSGDPAWRNLRPPLVSLDPGQEQRLLAKFNALG